MEDKNYNEAFKFMEARELSKDYENGVLDFARHLDKIEDAEKEKMADYYEKLEKANLALGLTADNLKKPENESDDDEARRYGLKEAF